MCSSYRGVTATDEELTGERGCPITLPFLEVTVSVERLFCKKKISNPFTNEVPRLAATLPSKTEILALMG
jgi:hypothetical protein